MSRDMTMGSREYKRLDDGTLSTRTNMSRQTKMQKYFSLKSLTQS